MLRGGLGADVFLFKTLAEGGDLLRGFSAAEGDRIDISAIDADTSRRGNQAFHFVDTFTGHAGEATLKAAGGCRTLLTLDVDGDGASDFRLTFLGEPPTTADGWIL